MGADIYILIICFNLCVKGEKGNKQDSSRSIKYTKGLAIWTSPAAIKSQFKANINYAFPRIRTFRGNISMI